VTSWPPTEVEPVSTHDESTSEPALTRSQRRESLALRYPNEWIAVSSDWSQIYAHGSSYLAVCEGARSAGASDPIVSRLVSIS
jgi:hypothetical protein